MADDVILYRKSRVTDHLWENIGTAKNYGSIEKGVSAVLSIMKLNPPVKDTETFLARFSESNRTNIYEVEISVPEPRPQYEVKLKGR